MSVPQTSAALNQAMHALMLAMGNLHAAIQALDAVDEKAIGDRVERLIQDGLEPVYDDIAEAYTRAGI